jgi:hypothetical protein
MLNRQAELLIMEFRPPSSLVFPLELGKQYQFTIDLSKISKYPLGAHRDGFA